MPKGLVQQILESEHDIKAAGHMGQDKTIELIRRNFWCVTNLARQAPWQRHRCHSHPCRIVAHPGFRYRSHGHPPRLGALTDLCHIAPVAISPSGGQSRPLSIVSVMLLVRPSPVIVTYFISC